MRNWRSKLRKVIRDRRGQSTTEYILILAVVVMVALRFKSAFQTRLEGAVNDLGQKIDDGVKDGN